MRRLALAVTTALMLTGCAADPTSTLRGDVSDVIVRANSNDAAGVRSAVDQLLNTIREQVGSGDLTQPRGAQLRELALAVQAAAGSLDPVAPSEAPSPAPKPSVEPSPSPSPSASPSPEPSPSEEPSPPPPEPSPEPSPEPEPSDEPIVVISPSPIAQVQESPAAQRSPTASSSPTA